MESNCGLAVGMKRKNNWGMYVSNSDLLTYAADLCYYSGF